MLTVDQQVNTKYAIPLWQRDLQIANAIKVTKGRIQAHYELRDEPVAVVGYGPSLNDTWEKVRDFKYIFSCSGAHRFLLDKGITPTWHMAVDPLKKNTVELIGQPDPNVEYLIASTCHPDVFEHLKGYNVKLWHVFDNTEEGLRTLPRGEWALTGGCDVGLRSLTMARFFGFTDVHLFGIDGSSPTKTARHAQKHPRMLPMEPIEINGKTFYSTVGMLAAAQGIWHELDSMPDVKPTFHGDGLIQQMAKNWVRKPPKVAANVAFRHTELISPEYRELNKKLHETQMAYGVGGDKHAEIIQKMIKTMPVGSSVLDYGCGKGLLAKALPFPIWEYDPAVPGKDDTPRAADLVACCDVLEHIEPEKLDDVLTDLARCVKQVGYFVVHTGKSMKNLADGRNAHLIVENSQWWEKKLGEYFFVAKTFPGKYEVRFVVAHKSVAKAKKAA